MKFFLRKPQNINLTLMGWNNYHRDWDFSKRRNYGLQLHAKSSLSPVPCAEKILKKIDSFFRFEIEKWCFIGF